VKPGIRPVNIRQRCCPGIQLGSRQKFVILASFPPSLWVTGIIMVFSDLPFYSVLCVFMHYALVSWRKFCFVVFNHLMLLDLPKLILSYTFFPAGACTVICCYVRLCNPHMGRQRRKSYWFFSTEKGTKNLTTSHCAGFISDIFSQRSYCCTA
jgi:hypothetical protein